MKNYEALATELGHEITKREAGAFEVNAALAAHPEIHGEELQSMTAHVNFLKTNGIQAETDFCGIPHAYFAHVLGQADAKHRVAILAEYDALPEIGHGCGHCASGSISLLAAAALKGMENELGDIAVDIIGTPDEEYTGQKTAMVERGVFDKYDFAVMIHMESGVSYSNYKFMALEALRVRFKGQSAHAAASPWHGRNALDAATLCMAACGLARQQLSRDAVISYYLVKGGNASNSIPDFTELEFCLRAAKVPGLKLVKEAVLRAVKGAAIATNTTFEYNSIGYPFSDLVQVETATRLIEDAMTEANVPHQRFPVQSASSDIGAVSYRCPAFQPALAVSDHCFALHTQEMADCMVKPEINGTIRTGAEIIARTILKLAVDPSRFDVIRSEWKAALQEA